MLKIRFYRLYIVVLWCYLEKLFKQKEERETERDSFISWFALQMPTTVTQSKSPTWITGNLPVPSPFASTGPHHQQDVMENGATTELIYSNPMCAYS